MAVELPAGIGVRAVAQYVQMRWAAAILAVAIASPAHAMTDAERCAVIQGDIIQYLSTGRPCACPYSRMRGGAMCGDRSAWSKPDGQAPRCYFGDVDGTRPPNRRPNVTRRTWPAPPPCSPTS